MLDIKLIREQPDFVRQRLATRGAGDETHIDGLLKLDEQRRKLLAEVESLKARRNRASKEIGALMGQKKTPRLKRKRPKRASWAITSPHWTRKRKPSRFRAIN